MKAVSVIIPVFNNQQTLVRALLSVVEDPIVREVIIVDDGSSDGSLELAFELARNYKIVKVLQHKDGQNSGACASRNLGLANAQSDWIQFLDADDEILPEKMSGQLKMAKEEIPFVVGNSIHEFPNGRRHFRKADKNIWKGLIRSKLGDTCANLWNRKFLLEVGGWDEKLSSSQEYNLMFRLITLQPKVVFDERYLTKIYKTEFSISTDPSKKQQRVRNWLELRDQMRLNLIKNGKFDIRNRYHWSGAVGVFCEEMGINYPNQIDSTYFFLYKTNLKIKRTGLIIIKAIVRLKIKILTSFKMFYKKWNLDMF